MTKALSSITIYDESVCTTFDWRNIGCCMTRAFYDNLTDWWWRKHCAANVCFDWWRKRCSAYVYFVESVVRQTFVGADNSEQRLTTVANKRWNFGARCALFHHLILTGAVIVWLLGGNADCDLRKRFTATEDENFVRHIPIFPPLLKRALYVTKRDGVDNLIRPDSEVRDGIAWTANGGKAITKAAKMTNITEVATTICGIGWSTWRKSIIKTFVCRPKNGHS